MCNKRFLFFVISAFLGITAFGQISWPQGKKAAVILTYDDGINSDWDVVMPQLEHRGMRGTFFLYGTAVKPAEIPIWKAAAKRGHELGNHTLYHMCGSAPADCKSSFDCLYCYNVKMMLEEIKIMNTFLSALDGKSVHAFAYPCGEYKAGGVDYTDSLQRTGWVRYARDGGGGVLYRLDEFDPMHVPCFVARTGMKSETLIATVKEAIAHGGLAVFIFHGVGDNYLRVEAQEHAKFLDFIQSQAKKLWVGTFSEVLDYVSNLKNKQGTGK